jgi:hypothetical protein
MESDDLRKEVERVIRSSEIKAVARALKSGNTLHVGETIDYVIEPPLSACDQKPLTKGPAARPYRLIIEPWHLKAAKQLLHEI